MSFTKIVIITLVLLLLPAVSFTQEAPPEIDLTKTSENPDPVDTETRELTLYEKTIISDINTADYYELTAWCRSLELADTGSLASLKNRLLRFYKVNDNADSSSKKQKGGTLISIESASKTDYFTIDETEEDVIIFSGNVILTMEELSSGKSHKIIADKVIFNKTENTISASGNISYELKDSKGSEFFTGDSMVFNVTSWNGVIYKGLSNKDQTVDSQTITYYYEADNIKKSGSDIIILNRGVISTQNENDPYFQIKAQKIMVLGPAEWGIIQGFLYIGHVPVFYIPFYYKPGNDLFFNPAVGVNEREGVFIQTTTYLIGDKKSEEENGFLNLGLSETGNYSLQRKGLFNYKISEKESDSEKENNLKYLLDYYSKLGTFSGFEGQFNDFSFIKEISFHDSIGVSRNIDLNDNIFFPEIIENSADDDPSIIFNESWNSSRLLGYTVPFRWGSSFDIKISKWSFTSEMYSDPSYKSDFFNRKENFDWLNYFLSDEEEKSFDNIKSIKWELDGEISPSVKIFSPWITRFSLAPVEGTLYWKSVKNDSDDIPVYAPEKNFFIPESFRFPYFTFNLSGDLINNVHNLNAGDETDNLNANINPREPWYNQNKEEEEDNRSGNKEEDYNEIKTGEILDSQSQNSQDDYSQNLKYTIKSTNYFDDTFKYSDWTSPELIDYSLEAGTLLSSNDISLKYDLNLIDSIIKISDELRYEFNYVTPYSITGEPIEQSDEDYIANLNLQKLELMNLFSTNYYFLKPYKSFSSSNLSYFQNTKLLERTLEEYNAEKKELPGFIYKQIKWEEDSFTRHDASLNLVYYPEIIKTGFNYTYQLPPLDEKHTLEPSVELILFDKQIYQKVSEKITYFEDEWEFSPLSYHSDLNAFEKNLQMKQTVNYDMEEFRFNDISHEWGIWPLTISLKYAYMAPYFWNRERYAWERGEEDFIPSRVVYSFDQNFETGKVWKNRMNLKTGLNMSWDINLNQISDNVLDFRYSNDIYIFEFLDLKLEIRSENKNMYLYVDNWRNELGILQNPSLWNDLKKSFNFFSPGQKDRYDSPFNLKNISLKAVHKLKDWDLTVDYSGYPSFKNNDLKWDWKLSVFVKWNPIQKVQMKSIWEPGDTEEEKYKINIETGS